MSGKIKDLLKSGVAFVSNGDCKRFIGELAKNGITVSVVQYWNGGVTVRLKSVRR
jgi:hypothetical protein